MAAAIASMAQPDFIRALPNIVGDNYSDKLNRQSRWSSGPIRSDIKGLVCGVSVEEVAWPLMRKIRDLDKLIDELAKGKKTEKILRR